MEKKREKDEMRHVDFGISAGTPSASIDIRVNGRWQVAISRDPSPITYQLSCRIYQQSINKPSRYLNRYSPASLVIFLWKFEVDQCFSVTSKHEEDKKMYILFRLKLRGGRRSTIVCLYFHAMVEKQIDRTDWSVQASNHYSIFFLFFFFDNS